MSYKEKILELRALGRSYRQIQAELNCSKSTIAYYLGEGQKDKKVVRTQRHRAKLRRELWDTKEAAGCMDCGEKYPHYVLNFDHRPEHLKVGKVSDLYTRKGRQAGLDEAAKCDIVCANCHALRTYARNQQGYREL
jgi:hypothetical protein